MIKRTLAILFWTISLFIGFSANAYANIAGSSAILASSPASFPSIEEVKLKRCTTVLKTFLDKEQPMLSPYADTFAKEAVENNLDCTLVLAIAGNESGYGRHMAVPYNAWGWCGGYTCGFDSWEDAIDTISDALGEKYCKKWGACEPYSIGRYYAADPNWANKVTAHMRKIESSSVNETPTLEL